MSVSYRLTLAGDIRLEDVAALVAPDATEGRTRSGARTLTAARYEDLGYVVDIIGGTHGYYEADDDGGSLWVWEPNVYVDVSFHMLKDTLLERGEPNVMKAVAHVLAGRTEDAALVFNGNTLMLTRFAGELLVHNAAQWYNHDYDHILAPS